MIGKNKNTEYDSFDNNYVLVVACFCKDLISISSERDSNEYKNRTNNYGSKNFHLIDVDAV